MDFASLSCLCVLFNHSAEAQRKRLSLGRLLVPKMNKLESAGSNSSSEKGMQRERLGVKEDNFFCTTTSQIAHSPF